MAVYSTVTCDMYKKSLNLVLKISTISMRQGPNDYCWVRVVGDSYSHCRSHRKGSANFFIFTRKIKLQHAQSCPTWK
ncbi:hypothetical protein PR048_019049 [Dryococelus australis]|uniref:Uncharacterized protein n=1 Tax=Dryococelus australis TaxID=614101 RepID=A0ABQ9H2G3_9NEOP|nr:hypothetical protein PR048_019049 [Dryococelus australis]